MTHESSRTEPEQWSGALRRGGGLRWSRGRTDHLRGPSSARLRPGGDGPCTSQASSVVTNNLVDFRPLHHEAITPGGLGHWGMVFMPGDYRRTKADTGGIVEALEAKMAELPEDDSLVDGETWL